MPENSENKYIAAIGDLVGSREVENRAALQKTLLAALDEVNRAYKSSITADFALTTGDEFQALVKNLKNAYKLVVELKYRLYPSNVRFGIGRGSLEVFPEDRKYAIGFDGEAFWRAREAIDESERSVISVIFRTGDKTDYLLQAAQMGIDIIEEARTPLQKEVISRYYLGSPQKEIASTLKKSQPNISRTIKLGGYEKEKAIIELIEGFLD